MIEFKEIRDNYLDFFLILPQDWEEVIFPVWKAHSKTASIYVLMDEKVIVAGGIIFKATPPNRTDFEIEIGQRYIDKGYYYIGYLYVHPDRRNEALGSQWLTALKAQFPDQSFWLTIEEEALKSFYLKNRFVCVAESTDMNNPEWMFVYEPD